MSPSEEFEKIVAAFKRTAGVTLGGGKKGFGSAALQVGGKIFAMLASGESFVVKLPKARVDELANAGTGIRFEPAKGRVMKEWLVVRTATLDERIALAREAKKFVAKSR